MTELPRQRIRHVTAREFPSGRALAIVGLWVMGAWSAVAIAQAPDAKTPDATALDAQAPEPRPPAVGPAVPGAVPAAASRPLSAGEAPRYMRQLARQLRAVIEGTPMDLSTAHGDVLRLRIPAAYLFGLDATQLRTEAPVRLGPLVAALLKADRAEIVVVGHTDTLGTREFNAAWSLRRATAVADHLQAQGIAPPRVMARGAGELELREKKDDSPEARERNRRIEIEVRPSRPSRRAAS